MENLDNEMTYMSTSTLHIYDYVKSTYVHGRIQTYEIFDTK